jgi:ABC-type proline/glycine betaine transport system permease subunit
VGSALSRRFRRYVSPYAVVLNVTPGLALTPIIIAWFGFGYSSKIALGAIVSFFPVFVNALIGLTRVDAETDEMFRAMGASRMQRFWKLQVPEALPLIFAGFKIAITTALVGAVVSEFSQGTAGIGVLMQRFAFSLDMGSAIAALLSMSLLGLLLFTIIEILDAWVVYWRRDARMTEMSRRRRAQWAGVLEERKLIFGGEISMNKFWKTGLLAATTLVFAGSAIAQEITEINAIMPKQRSANYFPLIVGEALGYFEEEGVSSTSCPRPRRSRSSASCGTAKPISPCSIRPKFCKRALPVLTFRSFMK